MIIKRFAEIYFGENIYLVADENTKKCVVIDPGGECEEILSFIKDNSLKLEYILLTHGHGDHIGGVCDLKNATNAKIVAHIDEAEILMDKKKNLSSTMRCGSQEFEADIYVNDRDKLEVGDLKFSFIHTPGHTKGSMCIRVGDDLFTGDTLFAGSMGRTDLYSGNSNQMSKSLKKLAKFEDNIRIYPGHSINSTIGKEKATNPFMK
jgi:glyoxylase-like metal-dependent hydrolase (beta-lactamase superfamily II)